MSDLQADAHHYYAEPLSHIEVLDELGLEEVQRRDAASQAVRDKWRAASEARLEAAGYADAQGGVIDGWVPSSVRQELSRLDVAVGAVKGPGLAALSGALLGMVASVWSLFL